MQHLAWPGAQSLSMAVREMESTYLGPQEFLHYREARLRGRRIAPTPGDLPEPRRDSFWGEILCLPLAQGWHAALPVKQSYDGGPQGGFEHGGFAVTERDTHFADGFVRGVLP